MKNTVLAVDVGGTNLRIALVEIKNKKPVILAKKKYLSDKVKDIPSIIKDFNGKATVACIGFAGPIVGNTARLTNGNLCVNVADLKKKTGLKEITLINDFHAIGYGVPFLNQKDFLELNTGNGFKNNIEMVVGPGTGLGKAYLINNKVYPCEGGLTTLAVNDIDDYALLDYLKDKYKSQVYYEDVISGRGLIDIYDHLEIKTNMQINFKIRKLIKEEPVYKAKIITEYSSKDKLCDMTLKIFTKFYARFVRDSALNLISSKVYLVGGISIAICPYLESFFVDEFLKHRNYSNLLKKIKVSVILKEDVGLLGCGAVAGKLI